MRRYFFSSPETPRSYICHHQTRSQKPQHVRCIKKDVSSFLLPSAPNFQTPLDFPHIVHAAPLERERERISVSATHFDGIIVRPGVRALRRH